MNAKRILLFAFIAVFMLSACQALALNEPGNSGTTTDAYSPETEEMPAFYPVEGEAGMDRDEGAGAGAPPADPQQQTVDRLVIRNANLQLLVADPNEANSRIAQLAASLNGFVVSSNVYQASTDAQGNKIMQASITVRVPSEQLDAALAQIRALAVEVQTETVTGQDVTAEFTDLESRLRNLEATEAQLINIMDSATKTEDVLAVFNQLTYIREQIEQVRGQMKYYRESAAMSAVTVQLIPDVLAQPITVAGWRPEGVAKEAIEALARALQNLASGLIWLGLYALPLVVVIGLPLYIALRVIARRVRKPRPPAPAPSAQA